MKRQPSRHNRLITGIAMMTLALLISLSILSYNTTDYDPQTGFHSETSNTMGRGGAFISHYLVTYSFGYAVLIPGILLFLWGWQVIRQKPSPRLKRFTAYSLATMLLISYGLAIIAEFSIGGSMTGYEIPGLIGGFLASYSGMYLGKAGTFIVFTALAVILAVLWSKFKFWEALTKIEKTAQKFLTQSRQIFRTGMDRIDDLKKRRKLSKSTKKEALKLRKEAETEILIKKEPSPPRDTREQPAKEREFIPIKERLHTPKKDTIKINPAKTDASVEGATIRRPATSRPYTFPALQLLQDPPPDIKGETQEDIMRQVEILETTLLDFDVHAKVSEVHPGPVLTLYEVRPEAGVKVNRILSLQDDLARTMQAKGIRIIAPIPGKDTVGIEIPNIHPQMVYLKPLLADPSFGKSESKLSIALGKTITGDTYIADLTDMPHLLIAGSTGSGKSVGISTLITSILYKASPRDVQFLMIDPKMLELSIFKKLHSHHLLSADFLDEDVVTKPQNAVLVLRSLVVEMEKRYEMLARTGVRNIDDYNKKADKPAAPDTDRPYPDSLEYIVVIIDELADLMLVASKDVEEPIARLAQMARAVGIHLVVATQRPSVDVLTGVIKANFPARIAYQVTQKVDSRTILDMNGAEQLLGKGDMLFLPPGSPKPVRLQNPYISMMEIERVIQAISDQPKYEKYTVLEQESATRGSGRSDNGLDINGGRDPLFVDAARLVVIHQQGSISLIQRRLKVGYSRAARLIDELEDAGIVGPYDGSKARQVLIEDEDDLDELL
ncbi:DNA translocase FtsK 4TM domain-containing protein [candidate division KSB1 bacterium]